MIKYGHISEVDASAGRARVNFIEDDIVSDWLAVSVQASLGNQVEFWPEVNTFVWCIMDENAEDGVVGGAIYDDSNKPPVGNKDKSVITFKDGTKIEYDTAASKLTIDCAGEVIVKASIKVTIDTPDAQFTGDITVQGGLNATGDIETSGAINATGEVHSDSQVSAGAGATAVNLTTHIHPTPSGPSSAPTPGT